MALKLLIITIIINSNNNNNINNNNNNNNINNNNNNNKTTLKLRKWLKNFSETVWGRWLSLACIWITKMAVHLTAESYDEHVE